MEKKLYYTIDNGDSSYTMELDGCMELIKAESDGVKKEGDEEDFEWTINPTWLTEEESENLPEAD
jgi:hypothetical protein